MKTADSLKSLIKRGQKFDELAKKHSTDLGSGAKGGDLGWFTEGAMVKPFNDASFEGRKGDMPVVVSQFGVHLIEIQDKGTPVKKVQVAIVERRIEPSQKTYNDVYMEAQQFAMNATTAEKFDEVVTKQGMNKRIADNIREGDKFIAGLDQPREMVRWAYTASKNDVSKVFTFGEKYVVAKLVSIKEKGTLPLDEVKDQVRTGAIREKKAEMLMERMKTQGATSIDALAQKLNQQVQTSDNVVFTNGFIAGVGNEPRLVGHIFAAKAGQLSAPVKGDNAVYAYTVDTFSEIPATSDFSQNQKQLSDSRGQRSEYEVFNALKEKANVVDNRGKFY
jgi:peptidyl-prolyl cis-trans isomerase D